MTRCPYCGNEIAFRAEQCQHCGKNLRKQQPESGESDSGPTTSGYWNRSIPAWVMVAVLVFGVFCFWLMLSGGCQN